MLTAGLGIYLILYTMGINIEQSSTTDNTK